MFKSPSSLYLPNSCSSVLFLFDGVNQISKAFDGLEVLPLKKEVMW